MDKEALEYVNNYIKNRQMKEDKVRSEEYINWLFDFTNKHNFWSDDDWLYKQDELSKEEYENTTLLSYFEGYIDALSNEQNLLYEDEDGDKINYFKLKNNFYKIYTYFGQGAITSIHKLKEDEIDGVIFVKLDEEVTKEELFERELVEYVIINKDLIGKISTSKFGIHIGHACTIVAIEEGHTEKFRKWYNNGKLQKKIVLTASQKKLEELEKDFYSVRDLGFTEVEENTLIAVSLGIMTRIEAKPFIKRMQLWKD